MSEAATSTFTDAELQALLADPSVSAAALIEEMDLAGAPGRFTVEGVVAAREVLAALDEEHIPALLALPPELRHPIVEQAIQGRAVAFLNALSLAHDKAIAKEAKRALHLLKARGVQFEPAKPTQVAVAPAVLASEELPTFMSSVDGYGERVVFFSSYVRSGIDVAQVVLSDEGGIVNAHLAQLNRKEYRRFVQGLTKTRSGILAEVPKAYARGLVSAALDLNARARKPVPPAFNDIAFILGPAVPVQSSPGRQLPLPDNAAEARRRTPELLDIEVMRTWMPPENVLRSMELKLDEVETSVLLIDEQQRAEARQAALHHAVEAYWTAEHRALWAERLFDTAFLLQAGGRKEEASWALATAHALEAQEPIATIPFCYVFFEEAIEGNVKTGTRPTPERTTPAGLVLPPE